MSEPVIVSCPNCGQSLQAPAERIGTLVSCSFCKAQFTAQAGAAPGAPQAPSPFPAPSPMGGFAPSYSPGYPPRVPASVTPAMVASLQATRPWVLFLAIMGFIGCGLLVIAGLFMAFGTAALFDHAGPSAISCAMGVFYLIMAVVYLFLSLYLLRYGTSIRQFVLSGQAAHMEQALELQKSFWRLLGIFVIVLMCVYAVILLVAVGGAFSSFSRF